MVLTGVVQVDSVEEIIAELETDRRGAKDQMVKELSEKYLDMADSAVEERLVELFEHDRIYTPQPDQYRVVGSDGGGQ